MTYESPIKIFQQQLETNLENEIMTAIQRVHVMVDKDELIRALKYDRQQYEQGYRDAMNDIVRCKECEYGEMCSIREAMCCTDENGYCYRGKRKNND